MKMSSSRTQAVLAAIPKLIKHRPSCLVRASQHRNYSQSSAAKTTEATAEKWGLAGALYLERLPVITPKMTRLEQEYKEYKLQQEVEQSLLSEYEITKKKEEERLAIQKKNVLDTPLHLRNIPIQTMQDKEELWSKELAQFTPADRETEADKSNDMRSTDRKLDQSLVLLLKQVVDGKEWWYLPTMNYTPGLSMREVAEQALTSNCGTDLKFRVFGNAPSGYQIKNYGREKREETKLNGHKVFIYKAEYRGGPVIPNEDNSVLDYAWVTPKELRQYLGRTTSRVLNKFIIY
ncbi:large ribosomal subunit protein mL46 [Magallana gigas]|uniref:large ribosomal subunit protein mL46 n=1 Tax=Magallana gigas TaxID=29159 RepID=UPI00333F949A